ncbi:MAG: Gfo/Idh/MocA family oxidoreductase [Bacteroidales bacterium]|nr:Gfo/Idh/MocA family oxidoreductase [Bacteroidales bacterium]
MSTRRDFLKSALAGAAALSAAGPLSAGAIPQTVVRTVKGASDRIRVGVIGVNSRGLALAIGFSKMPLCSVTALCDCDSDALERARSQVRNVTGHIPKGFKDIRKFLEYKEMDAVVIAMPDHWHAKAAIMAMEAGKHVYLEKPTSYCPSENEALLRTEQATGMVITVGNQRRSWPGIIQAIQEVRGGAIGKVSYAKTWYTANRGPIGRGKAVPVPANLDWDLWQGPAPRVQEFHDNYIHYNWHWFERWGTGEALNNGTHFVDLMRWGLDVGFPTQVTSVGGRFRYDDDWEFPDTQMITFQFSDKASGWWEGRSCNSTPSDGAGLGVAFYGESGALYLSGGNDYRIIDMKGGLVKEVKSEMTFEPANTINPSEKLDMLHFANWFDAIRTGAALNSPLREACISTQLVQLGNIAQKVGHSLSIDPSTGHIIGSPDAQRLFTRTYEPGWEI